MGNVYKIIYLRQAVRHIKCIKTDKKYQNQNFNKPQIVLVIVCLEFEI